MHKVMVVIVSLLAAFAFGLAFGTVSKSLIVGIVAGILAGGGLAFLFSRLFKAAMAPFKNREKHASIEQQLKELENELESKSPSQK